MADGGPPCVSGYAPATVLRMPIRTRRHTLADGDDHEAHRQSASLLADAIAEHHMVIRRLASALDAAPDRLYEVAAEVQESRPLNTLRLSVALVDCLVSYSGLHLDDLLLEFIPAGWIDETRRVLLTVTQVEEGSPTWDEMINDLLHLRGLLASPHPGTDLHGPAGPPSVSRHGGIL